MRRRHSDRLIRSLPVLLLSLFIVSLLPGCTEAGAWDSIRQEINRSDPVPAPSATLAVTYTTGTISSYLFDVPVMVRLTPDRIDYTLFGQSMPEVGFYLGSDTGQSDPLSWECSLWDPSGDSIFWVRVPVVPPGDAVELHQYIGDPQIATVENAGDVWRNGYVAVLHFDDPDSIYRDSSRFGNHGLNGEQTVRGHTAASSSPGIIGYAIDFTDPTDAIIFPESPTTHNMRPFNLIAFTNLRSFDDPARLLSKGDRYLAYDATGSALSVDMRLQHWYPLDPGTSSDDPNDVFGSVQITGYPLNSWEIWSWDWGGEQYDASTAFYRGTAQYTNGDFQVPDADLTVGYGAADIEMDDDSAKPLVIGNGDWDGASTRRVDGMVDELRLSRVSRSPDWIRFQNGVLRETVTSYGAWQLQ